MKNYTKTRQQLRHLGWSRGDRTNNGTNYEKWYRKNGQSATLSFKDACLTQGLTPSHKEILESEPFRHPKHSIVTLPRKAQHKTQFIELEEAVNGWAKGQEIKVIAGRAGVGKSNLITIYDDTDMKRAYLVSKILYENGAVILATLFYPKQHIMIDKKSKEVYGENLRFFYASIDRK